MLKPYNMIVLTERTLGLINMTAEKVVKGVDKVSVGVHKGYRVLKRRLDTYFINELSRQVQERAKLRRHMALELTKLDRTTAKLMNARNTYQERLDDNT